MRPCPPPLIHFGQGRSWNPLYTCMVIIECLQIGYQISFLQYSLFYLNIVSIKYIALIHGQMALFFVTSIVLLLYFVSFNGSQFMAIALTLLNYGKLTFDTCCYGVFMNSDRQLTMPLLDVAQVYFITQVFRFLCICIYLYHGTRIDVMNSEVFEKEDCSSEENDERAEKK